MSSRTRRILLGAVPALASLVLVAPGGTAAGKGGRQEPRALRTAAAAQTAGSETTPADLPPRPGPSDPVEVAAFLDGLMGAFMADHHIAGATVSVVRHEELLFSEGYGFADVDAGVPVDPASTLFRIGSISKLFTWTAVMQQVEEGNLDLDADVNDYLDFRVPDTYPEPITLRNLLTHTPGFEDRAFGLFGETELSRGEWLERNMPARVRPPGTYASYSNYGTSLAGYIVERVSGMPWEEYIEERILKPLGMKHVTGRQPLPEELVPDMSKAYLFKNGRHEEKPFEMIDASAPAGAVSASADAMAKFMIAHLQDGRLGEARILREETARRMHARQFGHDPRLNGFALGFYEQSSHGLRLIGHGGDTQWFHSDLSLIPSEGVGVFISTNTAGGGEITFGPFLEAFLDHYYPVPSAAPPAPPDNFAEEAGKLAGTYLFNRHSYTTLEKVQALMGGEIKVTVGEPGELIVTTPFGPARPRWVEPGLFREPEESLDVAFEKNDAGEVVHLFLGLAPMMAGDRLSFGQRPAVHRVVLGTCLLLFTSILLLMPIRYLVQRSVNGVEPLRGRERGLRWLALAVTLVNAGFLVGSALAFTPDQLLAGERTALNLLLVLPVVSAVGALAVAAGAVLAWRSRLWGWWGRIHFTLFAAAAVVFVLELNYWNLLGWKI